MWKFNQTKYQGWLCLQKVTKSNQDFKKVKNCEKCINKWSGLDENTLFGSYKTSLLKNPSLWLDKLQKRSIVRKIHNFRQVIWEDNFTNLNEPNTIFYSSYFFLECLV